MSDEEEIREFTGRFYPEKRKRKLEAYKLQSVNILKKVAIVSGASYGMGFSMAELFTKEGARVVMTARGHLCRYCYANRMGRL